MPPIWRHDFRPLQVIDSSNRHGLRRAARKSSNNITPKQTLKQVRPRSPQLTQRQRQTRKHKDGPFAYVIRDRHPEEIKCPEHQDRPDE